MKIKTFAGILLFTMLISCNTQTDQRPSTATDTGREFIRATLDGDFKKAEALLLNEPQNIQLFDSYKEFYGHLSGQQKQAYKNASYNINSFTDLNDSVSVINYSNSYMQKPMNVKLVRKEKIWYVDFKYTSEDSTGNK
jgi:hypothetical protein